MLKHSLLVNLRDLPVNSMNSNSQYGTRQIKPRAVLKFHSFRSFISFIVRELVHVNPIHSLSALTCNCIFLGSFKIIEKQNLFKTEFSHSVFNEQSGLPKH